MTKSLQESAALQEWRKIYNPQKAEAKKEELKKTIERVSNQASSKRSISEPLFSM